MVHSEVIYRAVSARPAAHSSVSSTASRIPMSFLIKTDRLSRVFSMMGKSIAQGGKRGNAAPAREDPPCASFRDMIRSYHPTG